MNKETEKGYPPVSNKTSPKVERTSEKKEKKEKKAKKEKKEKKEKKNSNTKRGARVRGTIDNSELPTSNPSLLSQLIQPALSESGIKEPSQENSPLPERSERRKSHKKTKSVPVDRTDITPEPTKYKGVQSHILQELSSLTLQIRQESKAMEALKLLLPLYAKDPVGRQQTEQELERISNSVSDLKKRKVKLLEELPEDFRKHLEQNSLHDSKTSEDIWRCFCGRTLKTNVQQCACGLVNPARMEQLSENGSGENSRHASISSADSGNYEKPEKTSEKKARGFGFLVRTLSGERPAARSSPEIPSSEPTSRVQDAIRNNKGRLMRHSTYSAEMMQSYLKKSLRSSLRGDSDENISISPPVMISEPIVSPVNICLDLHGYVPIKKGLLEMKHGGLLSTKWEKRLVSLDGGFLVDPLVSTGSRLSLAETEIRDVTSIEKHHLLSFTLASRSSSRKFKEITFGNFVDEFERDSWLQSFQINIDLASIRSFGSLLIAQAAKTPTGVPIFIQQAIQYLSRPEILKTEGIFRMSPNSLDVQEWKQAVDTGSFTLMKEKDPHVIANLLKQYFRELPNPLMTFQLYEIWMGLSEKDYDLSDIIQTCQILPESHQLTLSVLLQLLHKAAQPEFSTLSKMNYDNLAICFGPNLMRSRSGENITTENYLIQRMIMYAPQICEILPQFPKKKPSGTKSIEKIELDHL